MAVEERILKFTKHHLNLLELERDAELNEGKTIKEKQSTSYLIGKGVCVTKLNVKSQCTGLYGRTVVTFSPSSKLSRQNEKLPTHSISTGDIVGVSSLHSSKPDEFSSGLVVKVTDIVITVAFENESDIDNDLILKITKLANNITYQRLKRSLEDLSHYDKLPCRHLVESLFGESLIDAELQLPPQINIAYNDKLDESQQNSVLFALSRREVAIIHGPPGTGKTTTIVELICRAVKTLKLKVLVCAPSNIAVDNLVEKLAKWKLSMVRLGHPGRAMPHIQHHSLDSVLTMSHSKSIITCVRKDITVELEKLKKTRDKTNINRIRREIKTLRKELNERETKAIKEVINGVDVVLSTLTSATKLGPLKYLNDKHFDLLVIDEAGQATEASCWIPLSLVNRCILAGDHLQLPPTIMSEKAAADGLNITLMERLIKQHDKSIVSMLTTQYRMHEKIMKWPSTAMYNNLLTADKSVCEHTLSQLPLVEENADTIAPLVFIDTLGCSMHETVLDDQISKGNEFEADLVKHHVESLITSGVKQNEIGIITPYNLQVDFIRQRLNGVYDNIEVRSVDGFQGREKEAIIVSLVRSNDEGKIGFLSDNRRINVSITRARRHLVVIGDSGTISCHKFLASFIDYLQEHSDVRSASEYDLHSTLIPQSIMMLPPSCKKTENILQSFELPAIKRIQNSSEVGKKVIVQIQEDDDSYIVEQIKQNENTSDEDKESQRDIKDKEICRKQLENFIKSSSQEKIFPSSLSSRMRLFLHEISEELNLSHSSIGEGTTRHMVVKKKLQNQNETCLGPESEAMENETTEKSFLKEDKTSAPTSQTKSRPLTSGGYRLNSDATPIPKERKKQKKIKSKKDKNNSNKNNEEDFDAILAEVTHLDSICFLENCNVSIKLMNRHCTFCNKRFCLKHGLPEIHGCGNAVKCQSRQTFINARTEAEKTKPLSSANRKHVERKLDAKLNTLAKGRSTKKGEK